MPVKFQRGVASVAEDLRDLIITEALQQLATKTVADAMLSIEEVNTALAKMFVVGNTPFEIRFGIIVGDVTIGELLPSKELRRTLSAQTEALAIAQGTAILLGYSSMRAVKAAIKSGAITTNDQKEARDRFLSVSGNLEGMDIKRNELVLTAAEIDPKFAEAIMALAQNAPDLIRAWRDASGNNGGPKK